MIKSINISNYKLFPPNEIFTIDTFNIPDGRTNGSGLSIFVGENGCGKSTLLDALTLPYVSFKADSFSINDMNDPKNDCEIEILTSKEFNYKSTIKGEYKGKGFSFKGGVRKQGSKQFLSSTAVTDQKFIKADGETKPKDNSPDLRLSVSNPWAGPRFNEIEYLILDRNRVFQTKKGTFNETRFDKIMENFNFQYLQKDDNPFDCNEGIKNVKEFTSKGVAEGLTEAVNKFSEISDNQLKLKLIDNWKPFTNAFFGAERDNLQTIPLNQLGSGYEMIFSLLYSYYLTKKENKKLIVLIDEPELHLHPKLQSDFIDLLLEFSRDAQIVLTTHSPLFVKQAMVNEQVLVKVLTKNDVSVQVAAPETSVLEYTSANEVNYVAFGLPTEEYHNELYEHLFKKYASSNKIKPFDIEYFQNKKGETKEHPWLGYPNEVSIHTFLRNQIHHRAENGPPEIGKLELSIKKMREFILEETLN
ncbi:AAA family ATPase [Cyclobacterium xiamenense]|uniref:AAA family ATPase n=1 Tax=Cyclobacterium xiamenense TaxID=1297121 RepID=UPI0035D09746